MGTDKGSLTGYLLVSIINYHVVASLSIASSLFLLHPGLNDDYRDGDPSILSLSFSFHCCSLRHFV